MTLFILGEFSRVVLSFTKCRCNHHLKVIKKLLSVQSTCFRIITVDITWIATTITIML